MATASQATSQPKLQNILFMTDFSACSEVALPYARAVAQIYGSTVHVSHFVSPRPVVIGGEFGGSGVQIESDDEQIARVRMREVLASGAFEGILCKQAVRTGSINDLLPSVTAELNIDLIVMSTHGRRGMEHLLLGSVAEQVFRRATCPVLTVGPNVQRGGVASGKIGTILYATDFSPASLHALDYATYIARRLKARIIMLHSVSHNNQTEGPREIARMKERLSALLAGTSIEYGVVVDFRRPVELILNTSRNLSADLIVMGAHGREYASNHAPWAVVHRVVCGAPCPVLTLRN